MKSLKSTLTVLIPPKLNPGWERLRRRMFIKTAINSAKILAFAYVAGVALDLDMISHPLMFIIACAVRYVVIVPSLVSISLLWRWKRDWLIRNFEIFISSIVIISYVGTVIITVPLYLGTKPYGSGEFSPARICGIWVAFVVLPIHHFSAMMTAAICLLSFILVGVISHFIQGYPLYWLAVNAIALIGVSLAALFTSYNRDVAEYHFFKILAAGVCDMNAIPKEGKVGSLQRSLSAGFQSLTEGIGMHKSPSNLKDREGEPEISDHVMQSMYNALDRNMRNASGSIELKELPTPAHSHSDEIEAVRIQMVADEISKTMRTRFFLFKEFKDPVLEKAFWCDYATQGKRLRSIRFSVGVTAFMIALLGIVEAYTMSDAQDKVTLLMALRYGVMIPVFLILICETKANRKFIRRFHPLILSVVLLIATSFQCARLVIVVGHYGNSMMGVARLHAQNYFTNVYRIIMYVVCGVPMRMPWAFFTAVLGTVMEIAIVLGGSFITLQNTWDFAIVYPIILLMLGLWRSRAEDDKARGAFVFRALTRWKSAGNRV